MPEAITRANAVPEEATTTPGGNRDVRPTDGGAHSFGPALAASAVAVWLVGVVASLLSLVRALRRESHVIAASRPLGGGAPEALLRAQLRLGIRPNVRVLTWPGIETPVSGGWLRPAVLLPESAASWTAERLQVVLQHELVHVARGDGLRHLTWRLVGALYWFHPLVRLAARQASMAREEACDETVLGLGTRPSAYARHLLAIAESLTAEPVRLASALPMVERSQLERRLLVILDPNRSVRRGGRVAAVALAVIATLVIGVSAAAPRPQPGPVAAVAMVMGPAPAVLAAIAGESAGACVKDLRGDLDGTFSERSSGTELSGTYRGEFVLQQRLGKGRLCARVRGAVRFDEANGRVLALPAGSRVHVETGTERESQRMLVTEEGGEPRYQFWRNGSAQALDAGARAWFSDALQVVAGLRQIGAIQGKVGGLQGQIGQIQGEVGSLQGQIGSIQGEEGGLQGQLGSIQGEEGSLQGEIGSHQGAIGSLQGRRWRASDAEQLLLDREIRTHEKEIEKLEAELAGGDLASRKTAAEEELRRFDSEAKGRIAEIERRIRDVRADERIAGLEREIRDVHADERIAEIERRIKPATERLTK